MSIPLCRHWPRREPGKGILRRGGRLKGRLGTEQSILGLEYPVLGAVAMMAQSGLGEIFGRGFPSWAGEDGSGLGAKGPK